ncbi:MAG: molybdenum cofactor biosynthesis protein MoaE [Thermoprotei archaeon]
MGSLLSSLTEQNGEAGAVVTFVGTVKAVSIEGKPVHSVVMEAYDNAATDAINLICAELVRKYHLNSVHIYHMVGEFFPGEPLVVIAVASKSRYEAYDAIKEAVDRYKSEPPIWKKEVYEDGTSKWIHES